VSVLSSSRSLRKVPLLCYVTDQRSLPDASPTALLQKIEGILSAGVDWVQIREKHLSARDLAALTREALLCAARRSGRGSEAARIVVNDRLDVALAEHAGGVHLGENSLPVGEAVPLIASFPAQKDFLVGVSCHSLEAAKAAAGGGASYLFFGPVFATPSKAAFGPPQGVERLAEACRAVAIPVLAIGGITPENATDCFAAGATGIAAIRLFQDSAEPAATIAALRERSSATAL
jgi:thiamine-phosphate pyrophosphorylase